MAEILLSPALYWALSFGAVLFAGLVLLRKKQLWAVLSALCAIAAVLLGLAAGRTLEQLIIPLLLPTALLLSALRTPKGGQEL